MMRLLVFFIRRVDGQGSGWGVGGLDPAGHPVMWRPVAAAGVLLLKDLPYIEAFFGFGGVEREQLISLLQLRVVHLKERRSIKGYSPCTVHIHDIIVCVYMCSTSDSMCSCRLAYQDFFKDVIPSLKASFLLQRISFGIRSIPSNDSLRRCFSTPFCSNQTSYSVGLQKTH